MIYFRILSRTRFYMLTVILLLSFSFCFAQEGFEIIPLDKNQSARSVQLNNEKNLQPLSKFIDTAIIRRFENEITGFEYDDSIHFGRKSAIIFTGSSTIRKWSTLNDEFTSYKLLNRGFGGSTLPEVIYYSEVLIFKHNPEIIVLYAGENEIANLGSNAQKVAESFLFFSQIVSKKLPKATIVYISIKPSPGRIKFWPEMEAANEKIKEICLKSSHCAYIDFSAEIFDEKLKVRDDLFIKDKVHLNEKGYAILAAKLMEELKKRNR